METRLHSYETYLFKYLLPVMGIPWDGFRSLRHGFPGTEPNSATFIWIGAVAWCVMVVLVVWYALRLKTVFLNETGLRVRGYITEIEIPFSDVASIKHQWFIKTATLRLNTLSAFGAKITFMPRTRIATEHGNRFTLDVLRELINRT
jgi:hypothetical protein